MLSLVFPRVRGCCQRFRPVFVHRNIPEEPIPLAFLPAKVIASNKLYLTESDDVFLFGVLSSAMHMAWVKVVSGRLKSDFQYSGSMVYNAFP